MKLRIRVPESLMLAARQLTGKQVGGARAGAPASPSFLRRTTSTAFILFLKRTPAARWFAFAVIPAVIAAAVAPMRLPMVDVALLLLVLMSGYCVARGIWFLVGRPR